MQATSILITGGAGFIGSRLAERLAADACVTVLDNFLPQVHADGGALVRERLLDAGVSIIEGDIADPAAVSRAMQVSSPDLVYHLAAETGTGQSHDEPTRYVTVNVTGTAHLLEAIRAEGNVARVVLAGTRAVYGEGAACDPEGRPAIAETRDPARLARGQFDLLDAAGRTLTPLATDAGTAPRPTSIYASSKLMQEYLLRQGLWGSQTEVSVLRLQNVYGAGQSLHNPYTGVLSIFCRLICDGRGLEIYEDGRITRDFVHVDDVVQAFIAAGRAETVPERPVDIGSGVGTTILDAARSLLGLWEAQGRPLRISGAYRPGDVRHAVADISAAQAALDWTPQITLEEGLARLVDWSRVTLAEVA
ncbi:NAD-dependent epimerase/dehydratase family protein [Tropicimonas sp. IMCC34011]|uniref:NAD-dependent epimerase/dehydratase family protein n=1 Tax=Tropicimonas sp. IMCC34011 TaxID=2248759 RepID=UPI000E22E109|nr:NAD-dependent epimerase/dehydratase family protein [Tropicimonas sp. IMCC34011]